MKILLSQHFFVKTLWHQGMSFLFKEIMTKTFQGIKFSSLKDFYFSAWILKSLVFLWARQNLWKLKKGSMWKKFRDRVSKNNVFFFFKSSRSIRLQNDFFFHDGKDPTFSQNWNFWINQQGFEQKVFWHKETLK